MATTRNLKEIARDIAKGMNEITNSIIPDRQWVAGCAKQKNEFFVGLAADASKNLPLKGALTQDELSALAKAFDSIQPKPRFKRSSQKSANSTNGFPYIHQFGTPDEAEQLAKWLKDGAIKARIQQEYQANLAANLKKRAQIMAALHTATNGPPVTTVSPATPALGVLSAANPAPVNPPTPQHGHQFTQHELDVLTWHRDECTKGNRAFRHNFIDLHGGDIHQGVEIHHAGTGASGIAYTVLPGAKGAQIYLDPACKDEGLREAVFKAVAFHGDKLAFEGTPAMKQKIEAIILSLHNSPSGLCGPDGKRLVNPPQITQFIDTSAATRPPQAAARPQPVAATP